MKINLFNNYGDIIMDVETIINDIEEVFKQEFVNDKDTSLVLVNVDEITQINSDYRGKNYATDVISFPDDSEDYLGDIFMCIPKMMEQAKTFKHSEEREFAFLLTHGLLHLLGYDHLNEIDEKEMFTKQDEILNKTKYRRV